MISSPFVMVVFGATGDLMQRKLMPALYRLVRDRQIGSAIYLVGVGRREITPDQFREMMALAVQEVEGQNFDEGLWQKLARGMEYIQGYFDQNEPYQRLIATLSRFDSQIKACVPRYFYLATPPQHYETILTKLGVTKLSEGCGQGTNEFTRVFIEKPFGKDLTTAQALEKLLASIFVERQIYRIDHYLGKETVQNILALRFANGIFEPTWNHEFVDHVQIALAESEGIGNRGQFYDGVGALRDVVQNHMLQMLALVAMEEPVAFDASHIREKRLQAAQHIACIEPETVAKNVVRGQYRGYLKEKAVAATSGTETFVALKLFLDSPRWQGVPFYLRTGKKLGRKDTEISLHFKKPLCVGEARLPTPGSAAPGGQACLFPANQVLRNILVIQIQPKEGMTLRLMGKKPGLEMTLAPIQLEFNYAKTFAQATRTEPYEKLLLDAISGDQTLFAHSQEVEASWQVITKILAGWDKYQPPLFTYEAGSWGPKEAESLIERDQRHWFLDED